MFCDIQKEIQEGWNAWRQRNKPVDPVRQRKKHMCPKCAKKGFEIRMDYGGNRHERHKVTVYDVSYFKCPRCNFVDRVFMRIEGKGTRGVNAGKMYGGQ